MNINFPAHFPHLIYGTLILHIKRKWFHSAKEVENRTPKKVNQETCTRDKNIIEHCLDIPRLAKLCV